MLAFKLKNNKNSNWGSGKRIIRRKNCKQYEKNIKLRKSLILVYVLLVRNLL